MKLNKLKRQYIPFMRAGLQTMIAYRMNFLGFVIGGLVYCFVMYYLWKAVFTSSGGATFMGFSMTDMVIYLFLSNVTGQLTFSSASNDIGEEIKDGSISMRLIKPVNTDLSYLATELGCSLMKLIVFALPVIVGLEVYRFCVFGMVEFQPINFLLYLLSILFAYLISFRVNLCFGFVAFYVKNLWGIGIFKNSIINFLSGALIPLAFMPEWLKMILEYMPFASMSYTPVMIYMGKYDVNEMIFRLIMQLVWVMITYALSRIIWIGAVKKLSVQGG